MVIENEFLRRSVVETTVIQTVTEAAEKAGTTIMISTILKFGGFA